MSISPISPASPVGPPKDHQLKWSLPAHIQFKVISPRNVQLISGLSPRGCVGCHAEVQARHLIAYHGHKFCPGCFAARTARDRAEANARLTRPTFSARAIAYLEREAERDITIGHQNAPEFMP